MIEIVADVDERDSGMLTRIPQVGLCSAEAILKHFGSLEHLLAASESNLR